jgi:methionine-rich copper-binding protein CopC
MMPRTGPLRTWVLSGLVPIGIVIAVIIGLEARSAGPLGLKQSTPAADAVAPLGLQHLLLGFGARVEAERSSVTLTMDDGMYLGPARLGVDPEDPSVLIATMPARLGAGTYRVDWHAVFGDAHSADGGYSFRVGQPSDDVSADRSGRRAALGPSPER